MSSLTDKYISNTYTGVLHAGGTAIPASTKVTIYDGAGNATDLELGRNGVGVTISGPTTITGTTTITGNETVSGTLTVGGTTTINGTLNANSNATVDGTLTVTGVTTVNNTLTINGTLNANSNATVDGTLTVAGHVQINDTLTTTGLADVNDLKVGDLNFPNSNGSAVGGYLLRLTPSDPNTIGFVDPEDIIGSNDETIVTRTIYLTNNNVSKFIIVNIGAGNAGPTIGESSWETVTVTTDFVPAEAKAIIGALVRASPEVHNEEWAKIFVSRGTGNNNNLNLIAYNTWGDDDSSPEIGGMAAQFHSLLGSDNKISFKVLNSGGDIGTGTYNLYIVAWQQ